MTTIRCLRVIVALTAVLLGSTFLSPAGAQGKGPDANQPPPPPPPPPGPTAVQVSANPEDKRGNELRVTWQEPTEAPPAGLNLAGYTIYLLEGPFREGRKQKPPKRQELLVRPERLEATVSDLKPWRDYRVAVAAVYVPVGEELMPDPVVPSAAANEGARESEPVASETLSPAGKWFKREMSNVLVISLLYSVIVLLTIGLARRRDMYVRPIAGLRAVDDAIGRATEMGRPILYIAGLSGIGDIATIASMLILGHLSKRTAAYETPVLVPCLDPLVMSVEREIVREAHLEAGKPESYNPDNIFYVTDSQFGYVAAVDGIMLRQRPAANFYMGAFFAESLILAETGSTTGAIQIAGTDSDTQLPFFITACDYTLMGEELYAASAYLSRDPLLLAQLKGQDLGKVLLFVMLLVGLVLVGFTTGPGEWFLKLLEAKGG
ncbi:MAG: fibronectin type III domain-containing protein [Armatimonadetes bacterium]|nr:fibronectin type III domain-containing protein [Armatimonadota bacterium]